MELIRGFKCRPNLIVTTFTVEQQWNNPLAALWLTTLTLQTAINSEQKACTRYKIYRFFNIIRTKQLLCLYIINIQMRSLPRVSAGAMVVAVPALRRKIE